MPPDVSVIIPTYNRLWSLPQAVQSCRDCSRPTEIIVVDDGSTDGTWEWLQQQHDVISLKQDNWGKDAAVNKAFAIARGAYIRFLDSDDRLLPESADRQLAIAIAENADVVVAGYCFFDESRGTKMFHPWSLCEDFVAQQLGEGGSGHYSAYLFRREFIESIPHRQEFAFRDDRMFVIEVALANPRVAICEEPTFTHRHHLNGRLQVQEGMRANVTNWQHLQIYKKALAILESRGELTERRKKAAVNVLWPLAHWIAYTHLDEACELVRWIYKLDPDFVPPENGMLGILYRRIGFRAVQRMLLCRRILRGVAFSIRSKR
jgi:glycosyltransferase involved in cell wall biosynthesis